MNLLLKNIWNVEFKFKNILKVPKDMISSYHDIVSRHDNIVIWVLFVIQKGGRANLSARHVPIKNKRFSETTVHLRRVILSILHKY